MTLTAPAFIALRGASCAEDPREAAHELFAAIAQPGIACAIVYCAPSYDLEQLAACLTELFGDTPVIGCTTAGEISTHGYRDGTLVGVSLAGDVELACVRIDDLAHFTLADGEAAAARAIAALGGAEPTSVDTFGFMLVDGLAMQEEAIVASFQKSLGGLTLVGGSAADGIAFGKTFVLHAGRFRSDCALLCLLRLEVEFEVFKTEHFVPTSEKMVVTEADPARRLVTEINGSPAAREYARMVGLDIEALTPFVFASHPVVVRVGGVTYVRSIQRVNEDESLTFFCAIDEGIVLTVGRYMDIVENLRGAFETLRSRLGPPTLVLGCDCILRQLEVTRTGTRDEIGAVMNENNVVGFATYGEQFNGMHVNQTFAGVAIGSARRATRS